MILFRLVMPLLVALMLSGCAALSSLSGATTPLQAYELRAPHQPLGVRGSLRRDLVIETPTASGALDTDRIMIRPGQFEAAYLPGARWTDTAPVMLQTLMLRSFEEANALRYVGRRPLGGSSDYALVSELTDFQAEIGPDGETVTTRIRLTARLLRDSDSVILGSRTVQAAALAQSTEAVAVVAGFNEATTAALRELTVWALRQMGLGVSG